MRGNIGVVDLVPESDLTPHQCGYMRDLFFVIASKLRNSQMIAKSLENISSTAFRKVN